MAGTTPLVNGRAGRLGGAVIVLASLMGAACSGSRPSAVPPPAPVAAALDASYDWHGLVRVPFQTLLKESPVPLHEVLLFHEEPAPAEVENKDCHAVDGAPPRFVGQQPETYLLCFEHDHLTRIEASVRLPAADAPTVLARACALWSKNARRAVPAVADPPPDTAAAPVNLCEGRDGDIAYSARLGLVPGEATGSVSITLLDVVPRT
jgi:hypothetical protein